MTTKSDAEVELGHVLGIARRKAEHKGDGLFATCSFEVGEVVLPGSTVRRTECNDSHAFQLSLNEFGHEEGLGPLVNHSCDPNCGVGLTECGLFDLVARSPIAEDEEITVDYAMRNYVVEFFPGNCECGSMLCRRSVTGWRDLPLKRRLAYVGSVAPYLLEAERGVVPGLLSF